MKNIDFLITTLDRYELLEELLDSLFYYYPDAKVTVADQSKKIRTEFYNQWPFFDIRVIPLPYDCGLSKARNVLVKETTRKYKLILEDDFLFTKDTSIEKLFKLMRVADIAGGGVYRGGNRLEFEHKFKKIGDTIYQVRDENNYKEFEGIRYKETGCVLNFFLVNSVVFDNVKWYNKLKLREHQHFFYRVKNRIVFTDEVKILDNKGKQSQEYKALKGRDEYWKIALEDLMAKKFKYLSGQCVEIEGDKIVRYRENYDI